MQGPKQKDRQEKLQDQASEVIRLARMGELTRAMEKAGEEALDDITPSVWAEMKDLLRTSPEEHSIHIEDELRRRTEVLRDLGEIILNAKSMEKRSHFLFV